MNLSANDAAVLSGPVGETSQELVEPAAEKIKGRSPWQLAWLRLRRDRGALIAAVIILIVVVCAIFAPVFATITGHGANQQFRTPPALSPAGLPYGPNHLFWLGTDDQGRDLLVRLAYGARISLIVGVVATLLTVIVGAIFGIAAGYLGRWVDTVIARIIDVVLSLPYLLFAIALVSIARPSLTIVIVVIAAFGWAAVARIVRGQVLTVREREYIEASRSLGSGSFRIMIIDVLPNVSSQLLVYATLLIPVSIVFEASLSFLGIGVPPPTADWGGMIASAEGIYQQAWWYLVFPSLALLITTVAFNVLGDGIRDALDPRLDRI